MKSIVAAIAAFVMILVGTPAKACEWAMFSPNTAWQIQFSGTLNETVLDGVANSKKMIDIDLYDTPATTVARLKAKGISVVCYFSAGSAEDWRPDYNTFPASVLGADLDGWPGEKYVDVRKLDVLKTIMGKRMDLAVSKGCAAVDPDNVDSYTNPSGFPLTAADQLAYNRMLATEAHNRMLGIGLKNDVSQISDLVSVFDFAINEQCYDYNECSAYSAFVKQNKAVFGLEYTLAVSQFCSKANALNFDFLKKKQSLSASRVSCR